MADLIDKTSQLIPLDPPVFDNPVGLGLRAPHYEEILETKPDIGWFEVHPENYFGGGIHRHYLGKIREHYPLSLHAVGLSLGADQPVDTEHLRQFKELIDIFEPFIVSDHVSWSASGNAHLNDLLPLPYNRETLERLRRNIEQTQEYFGRQIIVENPSTYIAFKDNEMSEFEFMNLLAKITGCGILLDVNNIYVQSHNHGLDPYEYIDGVNKNAIFEIHLAGHTEKTIGDHSLLIDTHNKEVKDDVWDLYAYTIKQLDKPLTLIEWDQDFPPLETLLSEASRARKILDLEQEERHAAE
ncbi:MAG: DUF692 domain-containing protein [Alphaproteobacteria bacterium]|nr:DUF692 domain-containing protein [Alphaproteobacteria bacterium]